MRNLWLSLFGCLLILCSLPAPVWALAKEDFGNKLLNAANFKEWPGIMPVVNDAHRVYHTWMNGNEHCYFRGDTKALNAALKHFAATPEKVHEVILLPGPAESPSIQQEKPIAYNWSLHLVGGIEKAIAKKSPDPWFWDQHPVLTVYVGDAIRLDQLQIPPGVKVREQSDLEHRFLKGLSSTDPTVKGLSMGGLAVLNPYSERNMQAIAKILDDPNSWFRVNAARMLAKFGRLARPALPALREALKTEDGMLRARVEDTIQEIEEAPDRSEAARQHKATREQIHAYCEGLKK